MPTQTYDRARQNIRRNETPVEQRPVRGESFRFLVPGNYALFNKQEKRWHFFEVDQPHEKSKWGLWTFLREVRTTDSSSQIREPMRSMVLRHIAENAYGAMCDYGRQIGECGKCHRGLTDPGSIAAGIGPVCAKRFGR